ncbi:hypothetical protein SporoP32a_09705 [Sporosarcina ureae]|nr:hypothetical protein SporoP32a_09705 [Sporosarcina ureae]
MAKPHSAANPGIPSMARIMPDAMFTGTYIPINPPAMFIKKRIKNANANLNQKTDKRSMFFSRVVRLMLNSSNDTTPNIAMTKILTENALSIS